MKQIRKSKEPKPSIVLCMAQNLKEVYGEYCAVRIEGRCYSTGAEGFFFEIYIGGKGQNFWYSETWEEVYETYNKLIKGNR